MIAAATRPAPPSTRARHGTVDHMGWPGLTTRLERALDRLHLWFQPVVAWPSGQVIGWETLARSDAAGFENVRSLLFAAEFLERVPTVGRAVRREVGRLLSARSSLLPVFLNVHRLDLLDDDLYRADLPSAAGPRGVFLEFTDDVRPATVPDLDGRLAALRELGFGICLDDVGLTRDHEERLARLAPDVAKIDPALVSGLSRNRANADRVGRILCVLRELSIQAVAKGVENADDLAVLVSLGCGAFQGFWFGGPQPQLGGEPPAVDPRSR